MTEMRPRAPLIRGSDGERFLAKVHVERGHWIWRAGKYFRLASGARHTPRHAALVIFGVGCPSGHTAYNACGVRGCVRPDHATQSAVKDARTHAHWKPAKGSQNGRAKLDEAKVALMRRLRKGFGLTTTVLAAIFGVSEPTVVYATTPDTTRPRWKHVPWEAA